MVRSLQGRLLLGAGLVLALGLMVSSFIVHSATRKSYEREFDNSLVARLQSMTMLVEETEDGVEVDFGEEDFAEFTRTDSPDVYQIWDGGGVSISKSSVLERDLTKPSLKNVNEPAVTNFLSPHQVPMRQVTMKWYPYLDLDDEEDNDEDEDDELRSNTSVSIAIARSTQTIESKLSQLAWSLITIMTLATVASLAGLYFVIRRSLAPVRMVAKSLSKIDETRLNQHIESDSLPDELVPVASRLNEMLDRLDTAFHREKDFSNNVAHELRTPLAGLKSTIEVHLSRPHEPSEYEGALRSCLSVSNQMAAMVESLLALSRTERNSTNSTTQTVELEKMLHECWEPLAARSAEKELSPTWSISAGELETDKEKLRLILRNLLANAVSHSDANGQISVSTVAENGSVNIQVANSGNRIAASEMDRVFERFWRGDVSRNQSGEHFGLGLTLVKATVESLGGKVSANRQDDQFQVSLSLPRRPTGS